MCHTKMSSFDLESCHKTPPPRKKLKKAPKGAARYGTRYI